MMEEDPVDGSVRLKRVLSSYRNRGRMLEGINSGHFLFLRRRDNRVCHWGSNSESPRSIGLIPSTG